MHPIKDPLLCREPPRTPLQAGSMEMVALHIVLDAASLLCANLPILIFITLTLLFPVSAITLSHVFSNSPLAAQLSSHFHGVASAGGLLKSPVNGALYIYSAHALLSQILCFPITITLWLLARTAILYIANCSFLNTEPSILDFLHKAPKLWSRLTITYLYTCFLVLGFASMVMVLPLLLQAFADSMAVSGDLLSILEAPLVPLICVGFAQCLMIFDLANVVSVAEKRSGGSALRRSLSLLKGKAQLSLILLLLPEIAAFMANSVFQKRVMTAGVATSFCEAPLLIFVYSFVYLFRTVVSFVFYRFCLQASCPACRSAPSPDSPSFPGFDHVSIAVEIVDQCRKL